MVHLRNLPLLFSNDYRLYNYKKNFINFIIIITQFLQVYWKFYLNAYDACVLERALHIQHNKKFNKTWKLNDTNSKLQIVYLEQSTYKF